MTLATAVGWGTVSTIECVRSVDQVVNYLAGLANEVGQAMNELAKLTQSPRNAPLHFRALRSGKGWLPKRRKNAEVTGSLMARKFDRDDGSPVVLPMHKVKDPFLIAHLAAIRDHELQLWDHERESEPALRAARNALVFPAIREDATAELFIELVEARREALAEFHREYSTPPVYSVNLPVKLEPVIAISWPDAKRPDAQLDFHEHRERTDSLSHSAAPDTTNQGNR
jgi:hypothetical protein